MGGCAEAG
ncbi:hypothetical protein HKBW3S42_01168, partial [Candidatus Hakubella thermalkaliphila]